MPCVRSVLSVCNKLTAIVTYNNIAVINQINTSSWMWMLCTREDVCLHLVRLNCIFDYKWFDILLQTIIVSVEPDFIMIYINKNKEWTVMLSWLAWVQFDLLYSSFKEGKQKQNIDVVACLLFPGIWVCAKISVC